MPVDGKLLDALSTRVDQSETVGLAGLEFELGERRIGSTRRAVRDKRAIEVHLAVDHVVIRIWRQRRREGKATFRADHLLHNVKVILMIPVADEYWAEI